MSNYPPPKKSETFQKYWNAYIDDVSSRENFKAGHLEQLRILCELYEEADELKELIRMSGYTYCTDGGRNGTQEKLRPEVSQLNKVRSDIAVYSKMLGLVLTKDNSKATPDNEEWD